MYFAREPDATFVLSTPVFAVLVHEPSLTEDEVKELRIEDEIGDSDELPPLLKNGSLFLKIRKSMTMTAITISDLPLSRDERPPPDALSGPS